MSSDEHWYTLTLPYIANLIEGTVFDSLFVIVFTIFPIPFARSLSSSISWSFVMCFRHMHFACLIWKRFSEQVSLRHIHWPLNKHNYHSFAIILLRLHYTTHIDFDFLFLAILPAHNITTKLALTYPIRLQMRTCMFTYAKCSVSSKLS